MTNKETPKLSAAESMQQVNNQLLAMHQTLMQVKHQLANLPRNQESKETNPSLETLKEIQAGVSLVQENQQVTWELTMNKLEELPNHLNQEQPQPPKKSNWMTLAVGGLLTVLLSLNLYQNYKGYQVQAQNHQEIMQWLRTLESQHQVMYKVMNPPKIQRAK